jgi:curved DNA-binding protein
MQFIDYYAELGVGRDATAADIDRAYRKLARQYHPDVNKAKDAEERFKRVGEAYEVLKDPAKRKRYDQYGSAWNQAQSQGAPPPGFEEFRFDPSEGSGFGFEFGEGADFSDFFQQLFGMGGARRGRASARGGGRARRAHVHAAGADQEARLVLTLEEAARGGRRSVTLRDPQTRNARTLAVQVPAGVRPGQRIRLSGQGDPGHGDAPAGDLYLHVEVAPHPLFRLEGADLHTVLPVAPWTAALGGTALVRTLDGTLKVKVPPGSSSGRRIRIAGRGFPNSHGVAGDLYAELRVHVPEQMDDEERELFEKLGRVSEYTPPSQHA